MIPNILNKGRLESLQERENQSATLWFQEFDVLLNGKASINLNKADKCMQEHNDKALEYYLNARNRKSFFLLIVQEFPRFVTTLAPLLILVIGGNQVIQKNMTIGQLLFAMQVIAYLFNPLSNISMLHAEVTSIKPMFDKVIDFLSLPDRTEEEMNGNSNASPKIEASNIDLMRSKEDVLFNISQFKADDKGMVLIHGENGCGKSSLFNIISGVFANDDEHLRVNAKGSFDCEPSNFSYLFYPNFIFAGTVRENIVCGRDVKEADYQLLDRVLALPPADKKVCLKPENLSLGEKQKIYLARTLLGNASCILLDEPGSNLDEKTEYSLVDYLKELKKEKLILVISHNAYYDAVADKTYEIRNKQMKQVQ